MLARIHLTRSAAVLTPLLFVNAVVAAAGPSWDDADTITVRTDGQLREVLSRPIPPGATLLIAPGTYSGGLSLHEPRGAEGQPITIAAADPKRPPVISGAGGVHVVNPAYLELRDLAFEGAAGNGLNVDDGGSGDLTTAHHVTLRNLVVRDMPARGNNDGIKLSGLKDFLVENCAVTNWGAGGSAIDMVGCHDGRIAGCTFRRDTVDSANGVQAKGGSSGVVIERCHFDNAGQRAINLGGSTGLQFFRPKSPRPTHEAADLTVRHCTFRGSLAPVSFVGADGAVVEDCVIYRPARWVVRILQENTDASMVPSRGGVFRRNVVVFRSDELHAAVNVGEATSPETFAFEGNWWYCLDAPARSRPQLPTPERAGVYGRDPQLKDPERGDFSRPAAAPAAPAPSGGGRGPGEP
jgi:hypothetical protein